MTPDPFDSKPADDDTGARDTAPGPDSHPHAHSHPFRSRTAPPVPVPVPVLESIAPAAQAPEQFGSPPGPAIAEQAEKGEQDERGEHGEQLQQDEQARQDEQDEQDEQGEHGDEAIRTLLWTAATERPVTEVAALVARLTESGELSSPADVALRAAAVSRPLDEVRQLVVLLNESGYDLRQAETTLRAAAVGRPIEDVVALVGIIGADGSSWRGAGGGATNSAPSTTETGGPARPPASTAGASKKRRRGPVKSSRSPLDHALAAGPGSHAPSPAVRSVLRWPAAAALFVCGLIHLPTDVEGLRAGGNTAVLSIVVTAFCLLCGMWLAARDSAIVWAATAAGTIGLIGLHVVAGARTVDVLHSSLGARFAWAQALAVLSCAAVVALAAAALLRHTRPTGAADGT
ncbi:hypothetical protein [Streptomyces sp. NPDC051921]|uniref:hypothetical protein n=1 Tax=Streptomyces sp. NPDC051921 TaxID=3155806 RepID=UPI00341A92E3